MADEELEGCLLPDYQDEVEDFAQNPAFELVLRLTPVVVPLSMALLYSDIVKVFHFAADVLAGNSWRAVDGGLSQTAALEPLINGIVVPSCSVALGTLTAITISSLRLRQIQLRALLNKEACQIRSMLAMLESQFCGEQYRPELLRGLLLLRQYTTRVLLESRVGVDVEQMDKIGASDSELDGLLRLLFFWSAFGSGTSEVGNSPTAFNSPAIVRDTMLLRSDRLALLQTSFPLSHWAILTLLATSIVGAFLFESDQATLQFLDAFQLRALFAVLTGALSATAALCVDLNDPFRGSFQITASTQQLAAIRLIIEAELCDVQLRMARVAPPDCPVSIEDCLESFAKDDQGVTGSNTRPAT